MSRSVPEALASAIKVPVQAGRMFPDTGTDLGFSDHPVTAENGWFVSIIRRLFPKDAGFALHCITGFEERTCYRYAAGDRKVPGYFIRSLLRTEQGFQILAALMDKSDLQWWVGLQSQSAKLAQCERELRELQEKLRALLPI